MKKYNTSNLRQFLKDFFTDEDITGLCFDYFPEVHNDFSQGMSKGQKIQSLLIYCQQQGQIPRLLVQLEKLRPEPYKQKQFGFEKVGDGQLKETKEPAIVDQRKKNLIRQPDKPNQYLLKAAADSDLGRIRKHNQDRVLAYVRHRFMGNALGLFIVADGFGNSPLGEIASTLAIEEIRRNLSWMLENDDEAGTKPMPLPSDNYIDESDLELKKNTKTLLLERRLELAFLEANKAILNYGIDKVNETHKCGCAVTGILVFENAAIVANVGNCRTYHLRNSNLKQITEDHSYPAKLVQQGQLKPEEVDEHPRRNVLTKALGSSKYVDIDVQLHWLEEGDRLLLCSDGLWTMIRDKDELCRLLKESSSVEQAVERLIDTANAHGGTDNIGVVVVELN